MSDPHALILMADVLSSTTEVEMAAKMNAAAPQVLCEQALFGIELRQPMLPVIQHITSGYPEQYRHLYNDKGFIYRDPSVVHCQTRTDPIFWNESMYDASSYEIMEESQRFGLGHGFSVPVRESDKVVSMISLARDQPFTKQELEYIVPTAKVLATVMHVVAQKIIVPSMIESRQPRLSPRELECLRWVAQGKSNTVIADILKISDDTVAFYLRGALKKLGVSTRMQAVALCVTFGLIT